jgi:hypothetical protein
MQELNYIANRFFNAVKFNNKKLFINHYDMDAINNAIRKYRKIKNINLTNKIKNILKGLLYIKVDEHYFKTFKINKLLFEKLFTKTIYDLEPKDYLEHEFNKLINSKFENNIDLEFTNERLQDYVDYIKENLKIK